MRAKILARKFENDASTITLTLLAPSPKLAPKPFRSKTKFCSRFCSVPFVSLQNNVLFCSSPQLPVVFRWRAWNWRVFLLIRDQLTGLQERPRGAQRTSKLLILKEARITVQGHYL
jgi:hypothetical protein